VLFVAQLTDSLSQDAPLHVSKAQTILYSGLKINKLYISKKTGDINVLPPVAVIYAQFQLL